MSGNNSTSYTSPNFVIPYTVPSNIPPALLPFFKPIYMALQNIVQTLLYYGGLAPRTPAQVLSSNNDPTAFLANNTHRFYTQAEENIPQGAAINLFASIGVLFVRNANATDNTKPCDGFCSQQGGIAAGSVGEVVLGDGMNLSVSGLTVGARYFLDTTNGNYTLTPPVAAGNLEQYLGIAVTTTALRFWTGQQIQH